MLPIGSHRLGMASSEMAVTTAVPANSTGIPAAISAPNTTSSSTRVIGTEVTSACRKSSLTMLLVARLTLASPASTIRRPGWAACAAATARWAPVTIWVALLTLPATSNVTRADRPSREISPWPPTARPVPPGANGDWMSVATPGMRCSATVTCLMAVRACGSLATVRPSWVWMSTLSAYRWTTPGRLGTRSACPAWPGS